LTNARSPIFHIWYFISYTGIHLANLNSRLAERLKQICGGTRGWSLQQLAEASGSAARHLSRVENAEVSPTAETLGALSTCYRMTISQLLAPIEAPFAPLVRKAEQSQWQDTEKGFSRRVVSPPSGGLSAEVVRCSLEPRQTSPTQHRRCRA
jgi:transcriptional regulator with XRE-family HTH domain